MNMNNYITNRKRQRQLFIVEGDHEKNDFLKLLFKCFPETKIDINDVVIYGTNIYQLYNDISEAYPDGWSDQDIDLPMVISQKKGWNTLYKTDFTNILLIFDYEHHDPNFSEEKIVEMQRYFKDVSDVGQLYLNYPMIESYQDFSNIPDSGFFEKKISVQLQPGFKYKNSIKNTYMDQMIRIPTKIKEILSDRFCFANKEKCNICVQEILNIDVNEQLIDEIENILTEYLKPNYLATAKYQISHMLKKLYYGETYFSIMRKNFQYIIIQNILKSYKIQTNNWEFDDSLNREYFLNLKLDIILDKQNKFSRDISTGLIWVLNTSVFFIPEYNFELLTSK